MDIETSEVQNIDKEKKYNKKIISTKRIVFSALFTALIVIGSYITIDIQPVPFTMQVPFVLLTSLLLAPVWGTISVVIYIFLGLVGVPVFSSKGGAGITYVFKPSFGYILGFVIASIAIGLISKSKGNGPPSFKRMVFANFIGIVIIYAIGMLYMYLIMKLYLNVEPTAKVIFVSGCLMFLPKEFVFVILTALLAVKLKPHINLEN